MTARNAWPADTSMVSEMMHRRSTVRIGDGSGGTTGVASRARHAEAGRPLLRRLSIVVGSPGPWRRRPMAGQVEPGLFRARDLSHRILVARHQRQRPGPPPPKRGARSALPDARRRGGLHPDHHAARSRAGAGGQTRRALSRTLGDRDRYGEPVKSRN